jgi:Protein of unknown function (DUF3016)
MITLPNLSSRIARLQLLLAAFAALACAHVFAETPPTRIQVSWAPTDKLTEVKDNQMARGWLRPEEWMRQLGVELQRAGERSLPAGQQLQVTINDIKLAGSFEPWRRPGLEDVRILKDIYPPRVDLHYKLLASDGSTIREGDSKLRDAAYLMRSDIRSTDPLRFDKRLLDDWVRREFTPRES